MFGTPLPPPIPGFHQPVPIPSGMTQGPGPMMGPMPQQQMIQGPEFNPALGAANFTAGSIQVIIARDWRKYCNYCACTDPAQAHTHNFTDATGKLTCPVLRSRVCPFCGATGDYVCCFLKDFCAIIVNLTIIWRRA